MIGRTLTPQASAYLDDKGSARQRMDEKIDKALEVRPFNGLTNSEAERLAILAEECNEVAQACMKILRHGYESYNPDKPAQGSNRQHLMTELAQVQFSQRMMAEAGDLSQEKIDQMMNAPQPQKKKYLHHQGDK